MGLLIATLPKTPAGNIALRTLTSQTRRTNSLEYLGSLDERIGASDQGLRGESHFGSVLFMDQLRVSFHLLNVHGGPETDQAVANDWMGYHSDPQAIDGERGFILNVEPAWDLQVLAPPNGAPSLSTSHHTYATQLNIAAAHAKGNYGQSSRVALIDTGCDGLSIHDFYDLVGSGRHHLGPSGQTDSVGHGTGMATIIQAIAPSCNLTVVRVSDTTTVPLWNLLAGIVIAVMDANAEIINLSLGMAALGGTCSRCGASALVRGFSLEYLLRALRRFATSWYVGQPPTFVAATGNDGTGNGFFAPARYDACLAVGSVNSSAAMSSFSTYGTYTHLSHVMAPGGEVLGGTTTEYAVSDSIEKYYGTSISAAYTTGVLALLRKDNRWGDLMQLATMKVTAATPPGLCGNGQIIYS